MMTKQQKKLGRDSAIYGLMAAGCGLISALAGFVAGLEQLFKTFKSRQKRRQTGEVEAARAYGEEHYNGEGNAYQFFHGFISLSN